MGDPEQETDAGADHSAVEMGIEREPDHRRADTEPSAIAVRQHEGGGCGEWLDPAALIADTATKSPGKGAGAFAGRARSRGAGTAGSLTARYSGGRKAR